jgi:hypothetical protein
VYRSSRAKVERIAHRNERPETDNPLESYDDRRATVR